MLIVIRGAGDLATGVALRLRRACIQVVMTEVERPTAIRRTVCFSQAIVHGETVVEGITARRADSPAQALELLKSGVVPVLADPEAACIPVLKPDAVVDAILAKRNLGTCITDAPVVIGVGPGFTAGVDCHAVVETMRGHYLGRVIYDGSAQPNTGIPGLIGGFAGERVLRAPADGAFHQLLEIGAQVKMGDVAATVNGQPMVCTLDGVLRGILAEGTPVFQGMKAGDIDPRCKLEHCYCASDKALAVGGGVLEAVLNLSGALAEQERKNEHA
ncbi:selenium-dependent molybdenum cofactor biosynthesis protein YqeB [uncultured Dysosmobacter sp.]|uniref:selenium-dependent molybdenum cofactor biosynthesis protein YqeB n=1 Tax=uncultured Dysosmobacter sp. TaxID=2591384 RepID=UPI00260242D9|nr:selenium-dependent molybdenum cofactor biosynthesis protein YqeB [uncultured Dysosmobacter sp.]